MKLAHIYKQVIKTKRWYSNLAIKEDNKPVQAQIYLSTLTNPYLNLALEEWVIKNNTHLKNCLYLYRNEPCVVIGRSQNPWKECNINNLKNKNIDLVRRQSGGGTVYHDLGNSNYFVMMERELFKRIINVTMVKEALNEIGVKAYVTERKDIAVDGFKISGSAYKITSTKAYHHGTMLINTDLSNLNGVLKNQLDITSKGVDSVKSAVINLKNYVPKLNHFMFAEQVIKQFKKSYNLSQDIKPIIFNEQFIESNPKIIEYADKLKSWDWIYGQSPEFKLKHKVLLPLDQVNIQVELEIHSKYGKILNIQLCNLPTINDIDVSHSINIKLNSIFKDQIFKKDIINDMLSKYNELNFSPDHLSFDAYHLLLQQIQELAAPS